jgi:transcriptional regulator with XRE-family HTH domain
MPQRYRRPEDIAQELSDWMRRDGVRQEALAELLRLTQPSISRILSGRFDPQRSRVARELCEHAKVAILEPSHAHSPGAMLQRLLNELWDGTEEDAQRVAALLRATAGLRQRRQRRPNDRRKT